MIEIAILILVGLSFGGLLAMGRTLGEIRDELKKLNSKPIDWDVVAVELARNRPKIKKNLKKATPYRGKLK